MTTLIGISGSLRKGSYNTALLRAAAELVPDNIKFLQATIAGIPLYDADIEQAEGLPEPVTALKEQIASADGLILFTPEYNNSIPGVFKNAIDWLSRPSSDIPRIFGGKAVALVGASPGGFGTILSQTAWLQVLRALGTQPWSGSRMMVAKAHTVFDAEGRLSDETTREKLREFLKSFAASVETSAR